jgi:hypothetical protein
MLTEIAGMIEPAGLQIGAGGGAFAQRDFAERGLRQNFGGDIVDRGIGDFMNEADVLVLARRHARDDFAPCDLGVDDGLAPDDPLGLEAGDKIVTLRSIRNDPLARLHTHRQIDEAQYQGGRAFQDDWEKAERGPQAVDPSREYVDGGQFREPITEGQRKAVLRLNRAERELGADGSVLVHEVLILGMTMDQISQRRGLRGQRWLDYFARRFRECLDRLALIYGFATERR